MQYIKFTILFFLIISTSCFADEKILLFVSLGMPDNALKAYLLQAKQYHIPIVIRGLYTSKNDAAADNTVGSFNDTATRVFNLLKTQDLENNTNNPNSTQKTMGGISINPLLFRSFDINVVPALVVTNNPNCIAVNHQQNTNTHCAQSDFDIVFGNIPIEKQLEIISEKSDNKIRANVALACINKYKTKN